MRLATVFILRDADAVAARALRVVHGRVRGRDERLSVVDLALDRGADADGDRDDLPVVLEALLLHGHAQPLAQDARPLEVDLATDHRELLAAVARQDVLGADRLRHHAGDGGQHRVTGQVTVGVVDLLEVVDVDEQQRQRLLVPDREADLRVQAIDEVAAVEGRRQTVAQRRLEQLLLVVLVDLVLVREAEDRRRADRDLVAVRQVVTRDPATVAERAVGRAQVDQHHLAAVAFDRGVLARDAVVEHPDVGALAAAERRALALELIHLPEAGPRDHHQVRAGAPTSARRRRDGRRSVECGVFQRLRHPASHPVSTLTRDTSANGGPS